ncbi:MAG TPA: helix-hairpin-helix domain-containing protein [Sphingomicrobium sp.]|nr:helix-hairpin-helix domain-containing protein [Sphingomicrobium sp.]
MSKIDLNHASAQQIEQISDIGPQDARRIIEERDRRGGFKNIAELDQIPGFGPETVKQLKESAEV